jgi:molecular chaperone DnaJ
MAGTIPRDPYEVLGVPRDADETTIKKSFRKLARELHPDVNAHDPQAEDKFKEAAEAYEILSNAERREIYDRHGHEGLRSGGMGPNFEGFGSISDLFEAFFGAGFGGGFGGHGGGPAQGDDAILAIEIELRDAAAGIRVPVTFEAVDACGRCSGEGAEPGTAVRSCERCGGSGVLQVVARSPFGQVMRNTACDACRGEGRIPEQPCTECDGRGRVVGARNLEVDVPAGIADGQRIRLAGSGHAGEHGGPPGDLYVQVQVRADEHLIRDGDDLVTVLDVAAPLAALGADLPVNALDGQLDVHVPTGTQPGEVVIVKGEGMPHLRRPERRGDLRVYVNVLIPRRLTPEQRELLGTLADSLTPENLAAPETMTGKLRRLLGGRR